MGDIIELNAAKLREAKADAEATDRLHAVLCLAADLAASKILNAEGRAMSAAAVVRAALGIGTGWTVSFGAASTADVDAA